MLWEQKAIKFLIKTEREPELFWGWSRTLPALQTPSHLSYNYFWSFNEVLISRGWCRRPPRSPRLSDPRPWVLPLIRSWICWPGPGTGSPAGTSGLKQRLILRGERETYPEQPQGALWKISRRRQQTIPWEDRPGQQISLSVFLSQIKSTWRRMGVLLLFSSI